MPINDTDRCSDWLSAESIAKLLNVSSARVKQLGIGTREKHYLVWGILRLILGVLQMVLSATGILCLIFVGLSSSATLTCMAVATVATLASRALFHGRGGAHR
jgi:hypothetical protein